jgi:hypothetical protein
VTTLSEDWLFIVIAAVFAFVVGFLLSWALLQGRGHDDQPEREPAIQIPIEETEERAALRSLRERQVGPLREFLALCGERVAAYADRDYRLGLYERSAALQASVPRDVFYAEVTHAINDKEFLQRTMRSFFRASSVAPNGQVREIVSKAWEVSVGGDMPSPEATHILDIANRSIEDYVVGK